MPGESDKLESILQVEGEVFRSGQEGADKWQCR